MKSFVRKVCTPAKTRYCLYRKQKRVCFENATKLVDYWGPKVDVYDFEELTEYSKFCLKLYNDENRDK